MASDKQIIANQENAKKSTGPKSDGGRRRSSDNALTHGLTAHGAGLLGEDPKAIMKQHQSFLEALQPVGAIEEELVWQLTVTSWRLDRAQRIETYLLQMEADAAEDLIENNAADPLSSFLDQTLHPKKKRKEIVNIAVVFQRLSAGRDQLAHVSRYEASAERSFYRALHALERMQEKRMGNFVPAPQVLDVQVDGGEAKID